MNQFNWNITSGINYFQESIKLEASLLNGMNFEAIHKLGFMLLYYEGEEIWTTV